MPQRRIRTPNLGAKGVGGQRHAPAAFPPGKSHGIHYTGDWVGPTSTLNWCAKSIEIYIHIYIYI